MAKKAKVKRRGNQRSRIDDSLTARSVMRRVKKDNLRRDAQNIMRKICPQGWTYDEAVAIAENSADVGYYIEESKKVVLTPDEASDLYCFHNWEDNRAFRQHHSTQLSEVIRVAVNIAIAVGPDGYPVVVNGQHTLWALYMRGQSLGASITIYQCRDKQALANTYTIFDSGKNRSQTEGVEAAKQAGMLTVDIPSRFLTRWAQAAAAAENDFRQAGREPNSTKVERCQRSDVQGFAGWMEGMITDASQRKFACLQGIGAGLFAVYKSDPIKGAEFVSQFLTGAKLDDDSPVLLLRNKITNRPPGEHAGYATRLHAEWVWAAWQKFCLGQPLRVLRRFNVLSAPDKWKIVITPTTKSLTLGGKKRMVKVTGE